LTIKSIWIIFLHIVSERSEIQRYSRRRFLKALGGVLFLGGGLGVVGSAYYGIDNQNRIRGEAEREAGSAYPKADPKELAGARAHTSEFEGRTGHLARDGNVAQIPEGVDPEKLKSAYAVVDQEATRLQRIEELKEMKGYESFLNRGLIGMVATGFASAYGEALFLGPLNDSGKAQVATKPRKSTV